MTANGLLTLGDIQRLTGETARVVDHALRSFGPEPAGRVGITRVWAAKDVPKIRESLKRTASRSTSLRRRGVRSL